VIETKICFRYLALYSLLVSIWKLTGFAILHCIRYLEAFGS